MIDLLYFASQYICKYNNLVENNWALCFIINYNWIIAIIDYNS